MYEHLELGRELAKNGVDLFIHSNGGSGTVPWRIVSLIRQYTQNLAVLVPHRAFSAATLMALGANEIIMHKMGCLGPIDPSVANIFNPPHPTSPGQLAPISVEDVTAFFRLVKDDVGITHEDELVQTLIALTDKIHPLAIGPRGTPKTGH
jgi:ClpP class serine protease